MAQPDHRVRSVRGSVFKSCNLSLLRLQLLETLREHSTALRTLQLGLRQRNDILDLILLNYLPLKNVITSLELEKDVLLSG